MGDEKYPALGFNPAPGNIATITDMADTLQTVATQLGEAHTDLTHLGKAEGIWSGDAAEAFAKTVEDLPDLLDKGHRSMTSAATALRDWASDLDSMQRTAQEYETEAAAALKAVKSAEANPDLGLAGKSFTDAASLQRAQAALDQAESALRTANEKLAEVRAAAGRLLTQHVELGAKVAAALNKARDEAPEETSMLEELGDALGDVLEDISDVLAKIGEVLSAISSILGVLAIICAPFPPLGAVFAAAAGVTGLAAAGTKGLAKAGGADISWGSIAMDAVGGLPLISGAARGAKVVRSAKFSGGADDARKAATAYAKQRADDLGVKFVEKGGKHAEQQVAHLARDGKVIQGNGRLAVENAYQNLQQGQWAGTRGFNKVLDLMGKPPAIDPMSAAGRTIDGSIKGGVATYKTSQL